MNRVLIGDCLDLLWKLDDESVDLVMADLPYALTQNRWDQKIDVELLWEQYGRIIKPRGVIALTAQGVFGAELIVAAKELYRYSMVWKKNKTGGFLNVHRQPLRAHEDIHIFYRKQPRYTPIKTQGHAPTHAFTKHTSDGPNYGRTKRGISNKGGRTDRYPTSILEIPVVNNDDPIRVHNTQNPRRSGPGSSGPSRDQETSSSTMPAARARSSSPPRGSGVASGDATSIPSPSGTRGPGCEGLG